MNNDFAGDSFRQLLKAQEEQDKLLRLTESYWSIRNAIGERALSNAERMARIVREIDGGWSGRFSDQIKDSLDAQARAMRDSAGSLMRLRAETLFDIASVQAAALMPKNYASEIADSIGTSDAWKLAEFFASSRLTNTVAEQVRKAMEEQTRHRLVDLAKPFVSVSEHLQRQLASVTGMFDAGEWARKFGMPTLDPASIATLARAWGVEGTLQHLRGLDGVDGETLRLLAAELESEDQEDEENERQRSAGRQGGLSFGDIVAVLSILLTLLIWDAQNRDSEEMETKLRADNRELAAKVQQAEERTAHRIEQWTRLAEAVLARAQASHEVQFVVRSRGAQIKSRKGGRAIVAEALPGQVVTLIAEDDKWIEISYFDFATGERHSGWALKKYFVRATRPSQDE
jgi:hypothetical protein